MPSLALDVFERQAEAFVMARSWRELQYQTGNRPGRGLVSLYSQDFPDFTSRDLFDDLQDAESDDPRQKRALVGVLAAAHIEGRTQTYASEAAAFPVRTSVTFEQENIVWREAPARWPLLSEVPRRHELAEAWRTAAGAGLGPVLEHWHEAARTTLVSLGHDDWLGFWTAQHGYDREALTKLAQTVLELSAEVYSHALGVYLAQVELPLDDAWRADVDRAFRAPRFDDMFPERERMPLLIRVCRDLGIELREQTNLLRTPWPGVGERVLPTSVPAEIHALQRLTGGYQDVQASLRGIGSGLHLALTDARAPFWQRWLGDRSTTRAYGLLLADLLRDRTWLVNRLEYEAHDDFRVIVTLERLYRVRRAAARVLWSEQVWRSEPGASLAADYEVVFGDALHVREFGDEYLFDLQDLPWSTLDAAIDLRAEVFAAQVRDYLMREFDQEWWHSPRAARFLVDELWRPGGRHSAEELLAFMGYANGFDPCVLWADMSEVLAPL